MIDFIFLIYSNHKSYKVNATHLSGFFIYKPQINRKQILGKKIKPLETLINKDFSTILFGAEGETRTLAPVSRPTPLAGAPRHQLEYFCKCNGFNHNLIKKRAVFNIQPAVAERVGFEPTVRCRTTVFKTVPL